MKTKNEAACPTDVPAYKAFHDLVYSNGVADMALILGVKKGTLYNKADADIESPAQPTLRDLVMATQSTGDFRVLDALNEMFGRVAFDTTGHENTSDQALLELLTALGRENGEFHSALHGALIDKKFSKQDLNLIRAEAFDLVSALMTLVHRVEGLVDD